MIKACIFDLDGTLCDTLTTISYFGNRALKHFGFKEIEKEKYKHMVGNGYKNLITKMLKYLDVYTDELFEKVADYYFEIYDKNPLYLTISYEGITDMLHEISSKGIKTAVLSNKPHNATLNVVKEVLSDINFSHVQGQMEGVPLKPSPDSLLNIINILDVDKSECLYIGDTSTDIETGKNAGVKTVGVLWGFRTEKELKEAGADLIAIKPDDILKYVK